MSEAVKQLSIDRNPVAKPKRRWKSVALLVGVVGIAAVIAVANSKRPAEVEVAKVTQAWPSAPLTLLNATGYVVAQKKASIASKASGRLEWLGVREGSSVMQGEVIARIENADQQAQVSQALANVEAGKARQRQAEAEALDAERAFRRSEELLRQGFISNSSHDAAISRYNQAKAAVGAQIAAVKQLEAALTAARVALDSTFIKAPFAGVVLTKNANVGDVVTPFNASADSKGAVVTMADMATLEVEADVSESSLFKAVLNQPCEIQLDALPDLRLVGQVQSIVPSVDRAKATVMFKIRFVEKDARVMPEMSAKVAFLSRALAADERKPRLAVNPKAIVDGGQVYVLNAGVVKRTTVQLGPKLGDLIEVRGGLKLGDVVVLNPGPLQDGAKVLEKKA
ncbi:efflux RND transporter periplasmic adaptor subunit [Parachitinimonas caeni]|uniref:Efflux RND transporter periplasmic adaptor subunit n=1 Tax=Parachitinimonas caeni TaxID=3031301 RepID=A0ABT7DTX4_9NEIS|nr:efflux RND transporter periplasmic adaptor subunit [Parachitinimonas caeni]MDK2123508.1 efflux RND transporter periplasmic adaptor subunit [Parachitinimonas caeni]